MIEVHNFATLAEASEAIDRLGGYADPARVAPLKGAAAHEVAVGPVHAGVIEPGHFRFQCMGEDVYNLQIFLGYQHRGVEDEIVRAAGNLPRQIALAETCAGDTSIAAATAFAEIIEARDALAAAPATLALRVLLLELERIANHVGDLGALAGDVAFLPTASYCGRIRGEYLNMTAVVCGNRFGRGAIVPGGARVALTPEKAAEMRGWMRKVKRDLDRALKLMFSEPTVCDRFDGTGVVPKETATALGLVGVARRASVELKGDVLSRALIRRTEIEDAHKTIFSVLEDFVQEKFRSSADAPLENFQSSADAPQPEPARAGDPQPPENCPPPISECQPPPAEFQLITATVNAWRGPLVHAAVFEGKEMRRYKIVDPSAHNWQGLAWALRGEQISNFPICNKSFNLSYCGTDR